MNFEQQNQSTEESSQNLYLQKESLDKIKNDLSQAKRQSNGILKESEKLNKELNRINTKRAETQAEIGKCISCFISENIVILRIEEFGIFLIDWVVYKILNSIYKLDL